MKVVTRYAPSPTGPQHIGGLRTALFCYLFAKKHGGEFILRIEDTDQGRFVPGTEDFIIEACKWAGIQFTQGVHIGGPHAPYRQSERKDIYKKYADELIAKGEAYYAFDTPEEIEAMKKDFEAKGQPGAQYGYTTRGMMKNSLSLPAEEVQRRLASGEAYVIRLKVPADIDVRFVDAVREEVSIHTSAVDDKVLLKSDGMPTYHLANVVDDHLMQVTNVIRGEEWLPSTPLHVLLYRAFGWEDTMPQFAHLPLLLNPDGSKMSKRNADKFGIFTLPLDWFDEASGKVWQGYREAGFLPEAFINFLALLGWNPGHDLEIMNLDEMTAHFSLERVHKAGSKFDMDKLRHFNQVYLRAKSDADLIQLVRPEMEKAGFHPEDALLLRIIHLMKERATFAKDFAEMGAFFFRAPQAYDADMQKKCWSAETKELLQALVSDWMQATEWNASSLENRFKEMLAARNQKPGKLMPVLRLALVGAPFGPGVFEISEIIGRDDSLARFNALLAQVPMQA